MGLVGRLNNLYKLFQDIRARRQEKYWNMSEEKANSIAFAIFYELGSRESISFMDEWRRRKAIRESGLSPDST